ncbi:MAG: hypothetical protein Q7J73_03385 [Dehalococcoidales bacterium]|nr:hypothetical protein [Dehalococcoidales bacterium]
MKRRLDEKTDKPIGMPDLKPDQNIELTGTGEKFSGQAQIANVNHTIGDSGYSATFNKRKKKPVQE